MLVRKGDGPVRWCVNLRKLNYVTVNDCYPLHLLRDCIGALDVCQYFTILGMASGYYQLEVAEEDRDKTAFITKCGLFSFRRMPFGRFNVPATFSRSISLVLRGLLWKSVIVFLDDVGVLGRDFNSHTVNLSDVLGQFERYGRKLKPKEMSTSSELSGILRMTSDREGVQVPTWEISW